jgi:hypothetical protein
VQDSKQLVLSSLALAVVAGATFVLVRALGRLVIETVADPSGKASLARPGRAGRSLRAFQPSGPQVYETGVIPVIVSTDGRGPGAGGHP